jgi:hypothetical protein
LPVNMVPSWRSLHLYWRTLQVFVILLTRKWFYTGSNTLIGAGSLSHSGAQLLAERAMAASYHSVTASIGVHERLDTMNATLKEVAEGQVVMNATLKEVSEGQVVMNATLKKVSEGQDVMNATVTHMDTTLKAVSSGQTVLNDTMQRLALLIAERMPAPPAR